MVFTKDLLRKVKILHQKHEIDRILLSFILKISEIIITNEAPGDWETKVDKYIDNPVDQNSNRVKEIGDIAYKHQLDNYLASILCASKTE